MENSENNVITDILGGNKEAYAVLIERYQRPLFNLMLRTSLNSEDALDLTQETFVRAYEKLDRFNPSNRFFPWLYTIGLNLARDFLRKKRIRESRTDEIREAQESLSLASAEPNNLDLDHIQEALATLSLESREAVILRFHEDMPVKDVAKTLGISISGAKMRIHRALLKLRRILDERETGSTHDPQ
ncbi:MAG: sigma-70 family RNA polymerase sigma factor [Deltaproteobacteria bacterium]|nr:sigma-70 family RNA polymerase sigma factor [Deltaproteobacteria bacterium]